MLKKIPSDQLRTGMFLHELCGSWMDHPFWRARFVVKDPADIRRILESGIKEVWIDPLKGLDSTGGQLEADVAADIQAELEKAVSTAVAPVVEPSSPKPLNQLYENARRQVKILFDDARMGQAIQVDGCVALVEDIIGSVDRNPGALMSLVRLKSQDEYTYMHSVAVCTLMVALARTLGLSSEETRDAGMAGLLHDMGKAKIPLAVLNKPGRLTDEEFSLIKQHPQWGHDILMSSGGASSMALDVCLNHHERVDGSGYPNRLDAQTMSVHAKMGAVCDVYDAVTSARAYKAAWDPGEAVRQMAQWKGHFDARVFHAFVKTVGIYPIGSLVRLKSNRLGVVLDQNMASLLAPRVKVFHSAMTRRPISHEIIDLARETEHDAIVCVESPETWNFKDLSSLWVSELPT